MNAELLSRFQFALTASFHFIFPPISMGLLLVIIGIIYVRTGNPKWRQISFFWVKVYGLVFAGYRYRYCAGIRVWHELGAILPLCRQHLWCSVGCRRHLCLFPEGGFLGLMLLAAIGWGHACGYFQRLWSFWRTFQRSVDFDGKFLDANACRIYHSAGEPRAHKQS